MALARRKFLQQSLTAAAVVGAGTFNLPARVRAAGPNDRVRVGVMGLSRGRSLVGTFAASPNATVEYVCDVDTRRLAAATSAAAEKSGGHTPQQITDFRKILDDKSIDALVIAAPDHWHAPATILACNAGKHVYCEKPASHNAQEGEWMVECARKHDRVVQLGTQRRSEPAYVEGIAKLRSGLIGKPFLARAHYFNPRPSIGKGSPAPVPGELDYSMWQGPAPEREYRDNLIHYNWHWFWHWGTAELGNNGVHLIDICRWGLQVEQAQSVSSLGGRYRYDDDQETPDTSMTTFHFGDASISWEQRSFYRPIEADKQTHEVAFYGDKGTLVINRGKWQAFDPDGRLLEENAQTGGDHFHVENFIDCMRDGKRPNADIEIGHRSTLLCHLGNISWRTGKTVHLDPQTNKPTDADALALWGREYRPGWQPKV